MILLDADVAFLLLISSRSAVQSLQRERRDLTHDLQHLILTHYASIAAGYCNEGTHPPSPLTLNGFRRNACIVNSKCDCCEFRRY